MNKVESDNKRIAKNTLLLYSRMLITILVGLYTSRIVLKTLGVNDYGIYNIVGGIVSMLAFLNSAMATASQRYISFELGCGKIEQLKKIFSTIVSVHLMLAFVVFVIAETVGLWLVNTQLNIAEDRMVAANWVYQCSILTFILTIISVPYNSCIIAHEHMKAFAYVSIVEAMLKLLMVHILLIINNDRLILYAIMILFVALIVRLVYGLYCRKYFIECVYNFVFDKKLFKEISAFIGWNVFGNMGFSFKDQGSNIILNLFCGTAINAARGIAIQVYGIVVNFSNNFIMSLNPQITKKYAAGDVTGSMDLMYAGCRFSFFLLLIITIPIMINTDYLLSLWLGSVPNYTSIFLQLFLISALFNAMGKPIDTVLQAIGKIKYAQIAVCGIMLCELPLVYIVLYMGEEPYVVMFPAILVTIIALIVRFFILKCYLHYTNIVKMLFGILVKNVLLGLLCYAIMKCIKSLFPINFLSFLLVSCFSCVVVAMVVYIFGINKNERHNVNVKVINLFFKRNTK